MGVGLLGSPPGQGRQPSGRGLEAGGPPALSNPGSLGCPNPDGTLRDLLKAETSRLLPGSGSVTQEPECLLWQTGRCISQPVSDSEPVPKPTLLDPAFPQSSGKCGAHCGLPLTGFSESGGVCWDICPILKSDGKIEDCGNVWPEESHEIPQSWQGLLEIRPRSHDGIGGH